MGFVGPCLDPRARDGWLAARSGSYMVVKSSKSVLLEENSRTAALPVKCCELCTSWGIRALLRGIPAARRAEGEQEHVG